MKPALLSDQDTDRIIQMAWEDRTPFEAIHMQFGIPEKDVIALMRKHLRESSFRMWRRRTHGRVTKHQALSLLKGGRFKATLQKVISQNKISKR